MSIQNCKNDLASVFNRISQGLAAMLLASLLLASPAAFVKGDSATTVAVVSTITTDYDWCTLTCPKTVTSGQEFEITLDLKNLQEVSRNWTADNRDPATNTLVAL